MMTFRRSLRIMLSVLLAGLFLADISRPSIQVMAGISMRFDGSSLTDQKASRQSLTPPVPRRTCTS